MRPAERIACALTRGAGIPGEMNPQSLPEPIEKQLSDMEKRHKRHQAMLDEHHEAKHERRKAHRERHFARSIPPITLV